MTSIIVGQNIKLLFTVLAIIVTLVAFVPYIRSILAGTTKPHVFSWVIWSTTSAIVFFAQLDAKGGVGTWPIGLSAAITVFIACLALLKHSDSSITHIDWLFLLVALSSIPFWYFTSNPLWAVVVLTLVDLLGFGPTIRKAYNFPHEENILFFSLFVLANILSVLALENYSLATVLFPASVSSACLCLIIMVNVKRKLAAI